MNRRKLRWWVIGVLTVAACLPMLTYLYAEWREARDYELRKQCLRNLAVLNEAAQEYLETPSSGHALSLRNITPYLDSTNDLFCPCAKRADRTLEGSYCLQPMFSKRGTGNRFTCRIDAYHAPHYYPPYRRNILYHLLDW